MLKSKEKRMYTPAVHYDKELVENTVAKVEKQFHEKVERIRYSTGEDWAGYPSLFFRILLKDHAGFLRGGSLQKQEFLDLTMTIIDLLREAANGSDIQPYFDVRIVSEQNELRDKEWE